MGKLLIVDDDKSHCLQLAELMQPHGWLVEHALNASDGIQLLDQFKYDFVLLDWNLPDGTGLQVCRAFRKSGGTAPIIFITGRDGIVDKEEGLDAGADDYITKPFDSRELLARIRSVQRRLQAPTLTGDLVCKGVKLDVKLRTVVTGDQECRLSATESSVLEFLMRHTNQYFSAADLFESIWPSDTDASELTVKAHMTVLRRKLEKIGARDLIETVRGSGYVIRVGRE